MANGAVQAVAAVAAEAAADAGNKAGEVTAAVVAGAEAAVATAEQRLEVAQDVAQALADSALQSAVGQQVASIREDVDEWESEVEAALSALRERCSQMETTIQDQAERLTKLEAPVTVVAVTPAAETAASILPASGTEVTAVVVNPNNAPNANIPAALPEPQKRRRWL